MSFLGQIEFKKVTDLDAQGRSLLLNCDFKFPMGLNCRIVSDDKNQASEILQLAANLKSPQKGDVYYNELKLRDLSFEEFLPWQLRMSFGFEYNGLLSNRTLEQNLMLPLLFHKLGSPSEAKAWVKDLMQRFNIWGFKDLRPAEVSPFVRKSCLLVRAFVMKSETIFLDEPDASLERDNIPALLDLIEQMRKQGTLKNVFFCSQSEELAECLLTATVKLGGGKLKTVYIHDNFQKAVGL